MSDKSKDARPAGGAVSSPQGRTVAGRVTASALFSPEERATMRATAAQARARLVFAVDGTASRSAAWDTARKVTDTLFQALPGQLDVALAVHGGSRVHTFTDFVSDPNVLRDTRRVFPVWAAAQNSSTSCSGLPKPAT